MKSQNRRSPRPIARLAALGALALTCFAADAADTGKTVRTPYGDVIEIQAPPSQQRLSTSAQAHPFATARQRAAVKPLQWAPRDDRAAADTAELSDKMVRAAGSAPGGEAPAFANYLARNHFRATWQRLDALDAAKGAAPLSTLSDGGEKDGAHYPYTRYPGNYYTSQWKTTPWNKIGKLYFTKPDGSGSYCTANVASGNSVLITAAHCVYTLGAGWNTNFVFVPAERYGEAPYGRFGWSSARVPSGYFPSGGRRWDVAVIKLTGEQVTGLPVTSYVGWLGRTWNRPYSEYATSHGYASNLSTQFTHICNGQTYSSPSEGTNVLVQGCDMTYGASGGGWLLNLSGSHYVNSVVSGPHIGAFGTAWVGPRFADDNIVALCAAIGC